MARKTRFSIAKKDVVKAFENANRRVFHQGDIYKILEANREFWRLPVKMTLAEFIDLMTKNTKLEEHIIKFPNSFSAVKRYGWNKPAELEVIQAIRKDAYFSHYSALHFNRLTEQIPKTLYMNFEQTPKAKQAKGRLQQENIDNAFKKPARLTKNKAIYKGREIILINSKFTNMLGMENYEVHNPDSKTNFTIKITCLERTLIDIAMKPFYAGGIYEVIKAYKNAVEENVSINKLTAILGKLGYLYPYHQVIGFYLEKAGVYKESQIKLLDKFKKVFNFYLINEMKDPAYSKKWKLYYPKEFDQ